MGLLGDLFKVGASVIGGNSQKKATKKAAQLQYDAAMKGIAESARQYDTTRSDFMPYMQFGNAGVQHYGDLLGLNGADSQQSEIDALRNSPLYKSLYSNGEEAVLANASATGGLRGGNTVHSLYNLGEDTLSSVIQQQLGNYGNAISTGLGATGSVAGFGANAVNAQNDLRNQGADAQAQAKLVAGGIAAQNWRNVGTTLSDFANNIPGLPSGGRGVNTSDAGSFAGFDWSSLF